MKIRILHLINSFRLAGAEKIALEIACRLNKEIFEVMLCSMVSPESYVERMGFSLAQEKGIAAMSLKKKAGSNRIRALLQLVDILKRENIRIIHTHCNSPDTYGRIASIIARVPIRIVTLHNIVSWKNYRIFGWVLERALRSRTSIFVAVSKNVKEWAKESLGLSDNKIRVIYNGIDVKHFKGFQIDKNEAKRSLGIKSGYFIVLCVGRLAEQKGQRYLIEAVSSLEKEGKKIQLILVGDGPERFNLEKQAEVLGSNVYFMGWRTDVEKFYKVADVVVFPSLWEGLPLALLEAMASGTPVISTNVSSIAEVINDQIDGLIISPKDGLSIKHKITSLMVNNALYNRLSENSVKKVEQLFDIKEMINAYEDIYLEMVSRHEVS